MPILLGDLCAFHFPKSGGSSMQAALMASGGLMLGGGHDGYRYWEHHLVGLRCVGPARNPWDWYPALYFHALRGGRPFQPAPNALLPGLR